MINKKSITFCLDALKISEWSPEFESLMRNRLLMGSFRYGKIGDQDFSKYDLPEEAKKRIKKYQETKNLEFLVDASNMMLLAFIHGKRMGEKLISIDDGEHSKELK